MDSGLWPDWKWPACWRGMGSWKVLIRQLGPRVGWGWEATIAENPVRRPRGGFLCSLSPTLMGDLKEPWPGGERSVEGNP